MSAILFDFFGTLVSYSPSRVDQGYPRCHEFLREQGSALSYDDFLTGIDACFASFDARSDIDDSEFSMGEVAAAFLEGAAVGGDPAEFERLYLAEWSAGVVVPRGLEELLRGLSRAHRLAVVSNTHSSTMVPDLLQRAGIADLFDAVVLSVDVGRRKPHPKIYATALAATGTPAEEAIFVGDSYPADFAGPDAAGITAFLIDPGKSADVPAERRIDSVFDLPTRSLITG
ncbi:MAG TPA: HAD family hydrolase [Actinoplanes sp.]|jgi:putative hydrolase of the HAD superfamily